MNDVKTTRGVALTESTWQELNDLAKTQNRSRNNLIEMILLDYLRNQKKT